MSSAALQRPSIKLALAIIVVMGTLAGAGYVAYQKYAVSHRSTLKPYFAYSDSDTAALAKLHASEQLATDDLYEWDRTVFQLVSAHKIGDVDASRIYAYLLVAQRDQAALSIAAKGEFIGDFDAISHDVLCEFFPDDCSNLPAIHADNFSVAASKLIMARVRERIAADKAQTKPYTLRPGKDLWQSSTLGIGIDAGSRKPWRLTSSNQFRVPPPPPASAYPPLVADVKRQLASITPKQRETVVFWAGGPGTKTPPGIWLDLADRSMRARDLPLETVLRVHSDMGTAMADAVIAVFDSKYTYQIRRPFMQDPSIKTVMPTPNHPSYPAGHATISGAAATVLDHYFPDQSEKWDGLGHEAAQSRTWGGIHFTIDNTEGYKMGQKIAGQSLEADK